MADSAELVRAVAALLWPLFAFTVLCIYRTQIGSFLDRLKRGRFFGQEVELGVAPSPAEPRPLASVAATESLNALLTSKAFQEQIRSLVGQGAATSTADVSDRVVDAFRKAASEVVNSAFVKVDSRPLLGRRGDVWEEPYEPIPTVQQFLDRIWHSMNPYVRPYHYIDGWVIKDRGTGRVYTDIGRNWARAHLDAAEDERLISEVGIAPGSVIEVIAGPRANDAMTPMSHTLLNAV